LYFCIFPPEFCQKKNVLSTFKKKFTPAKSRKQETFFFGVAERDGPYSIAARNVTVIDGYSKDIVGFALWAFSWAMPVSAVSIFHVAWNNIVSKTLPSIAESERIEELLNIQGGTATILPWVFIGLVHCAQTKELLKNTARISRACRGRNRHDNATIENGGGARNPKM